MLNILSKSRALIFAASAALLTVQAIAAPQTVDLSNPAVTSGVINGAIYMIDATHPAGTGIFGGKGAVFETIHREGNKVTEEEGYNTDGGLPMDTKRPHWNNDVQMSSLHTSVVNGVEYVVFLLDINEPASKGKNLLSLDDVKIFTSPVASVNDPSLPDLLGNPDLTLRYDLDAGGATRGSNWVLLDYNRNGQGSGTGDMALLVPLSFFAGAAPTDYLYLYSKFGADVADAAPDAGFEEWTRGGEVPIEFPECIITLPEIDTEVTISVVGNYPTSFLLSTLSNVPAGFTVTNGSYIGWCVDSFLPIDPGPSYTGRLVSTLDAAGLADIGASDPDWGIVNYIINHREDYMNILGATATEVQLAIWNYVGGGGIGQTYLEAGQIPGFPLPDLGIVAQIVADASTHGNFVPGDGDVTAIVVDLFGFFQRTIIEVVCEDCCGN
jgi:hypothetical protein